MTTNTCGATHKSTLIQQKMLYPASAHVITVPDMNDKGAQPLKPSYSPLKTVNVQKDYRYPSDRSYFVAISTAPYHTSVLYQWSLKGYLGTCGGSTLVSHQRVMSIIVVVIMTMAALVFSYNNEAKI